MKIKNLSNRFCLKNRVLWILKALWIVLSKTINILINLQINFLRWLLLNGFMWSRNAKCYFFAVFYTVFWWKYLKNTARILFFSKFITTHVYIAQWVKIVFFFIQNTFFFSPENTANFVARLASRWRYDPGIPLWSKCCVPGIQPCKKKKKKNIHYRPIANNYTHFKINIYPYLLLRKYTLKQIFLFTLCRYDWRLHKFWFSCHAFLTISNNKK